MPGSDLLRQAFRRFPTGIAVITATDGDGTKLGLTVNSLTSVSLDPPLLLWCLRTNAGCYPGFRDAPFFCVNFLAIDQSWLSSRFATTPPPERFRGVADNTQRWNVPVLEGTAAHLICRNAGTQAMGDHHLMMGEVVDGAVGGGESLLFYHGRYASANSAFPSREPSFDFLNGAISWDFG